MQKDVEKLLENLLETVENKSVSFFNSSTDGYDYLFNNINNELFISIDGVSFYNAKEAIEYLKVNPYYQIITIDKENLSMYESLGHPIKLYDLILDQKKVSNNDFKKIVNFLTTYYFNEYDVEDNKYDFEIYEFINENTEEAVIDEFVDNDIFGLELVEHYIDSRENSIDLNILSLNMDKLENEINPTLDDFSFAFDLYRQIIFDIYEYLISIDFTTKDSISFITGYLYSDINLNYELYEKYFGNLDIDRKKIITIQKLLIISDYYRNNFEAGKDYKIINNINEFYIRQIRDKGIVDIIKLFDKSADFKDKCLINFISNYNKQYNDITDSKTLKKINPFYNIERLVRKNNQ